MKISTVFMNLWLAAKKAPASAKNSFSFLQHINVDFQFLRHLAESNLSAKLYYLSFKLPVINFLLCHFLTSILTSFL